MKRGWKFFWITCASLTGLGIIACITSVVLGVSWESVDAAYPDRASYINWGDHYSYDDDRDYDEDYYEEDYYEEDHEEEWRNTNPVDEKGVKSSIPADGQAFSDVQEFSLEVTGAEVLVQEYDGDKIIVDPSRLSSRSQRAFSSIQDGSELEILIKDKSLLRGSGQGTLVISIPKKQAFTEASFELGAGFLSIENIKATDLSIDVGAGKADVEWCEASQLDVSCGTGEVSITGTPALEADLECGVGYVSYTVGGSEADYNYSLKCGIGNISVGNESYSGLGSKKIIDNGKKQMMDIDCGIGQVEVSFNKDL